MLTIHLSHIAIENTEKKSYSDYKCQSTDNADGNNAGANRQEIKYTAAEIVGEGTVDAFKILAEWAQESTARYHIMETNLGEEHTRE